MNFLDGNDMIQVDTDDASILQFDLSISRNIAPGIFILALFDFVLP